MPRRKEATLDALRMEPESALGPLQARRGLTRSSPVSTQTLTSSLHREKKKMPPCNLPHLCNDSEPTFPITMKARVSELQSFSQHSQ